MKKEGTTLVELIVIITILFIIGTITFIFLQGHKNEAIKFKNDFDKKVELCFDLGGFYDNYTGIYCYFKLGTSVKDFQIKKVKLNDLYLLKK